MYSNLRASNSTPGFAKQLLQEESADEVADGQAVGLGDLVHIVGGNQKSRAGHVVDDEGRVAGDMFAHVAGDGAGVGVVAAAGGGADDDPDGLAAIKIFLGKGVETQSQQNEQRPNGRPWFHGGSL